jgi:para-nitrobenzyl esterase
MLRLVQVENGLLQGIPAADPQITVFKGVPFAAPPVGDLRWRAPQPAANWTGVRKADTFGPISFQEVPGADPAGFYTKEWHVDSTIPMSEDCLYLNVWTPAKSAGEKLPVMIWIYGGAFQSGYTAEMEFDGERLARRGIVLVTIAYRVNVFAWFAHPELTASQSGEFWGNFGFLDQMAAFQWVQRNISAFGGDPGQVTISGQSAGAGSCLAHLVSPLTKGLFGKAIIMSGGGIRSYDMKPDQTLAQVEQKGVRFLDFLGVRTVAEARRIDAQTLFDKSREFGPFLTWIHFTDGKFLTQDWTRALLANQRHPVQVMAGHTSNDFMAVPKAATPAEFADYARQQFGERADEYLAICGFTPDGDLPAMLARASYPRQELGSAIWVQKNAEQGNDPIYYYQFCAEIPGDNAGAFHSSDLWFVFETLAKCWRPFVGKHYDLARLMCNYWTNFVKTGNPNGPDADGTPMPEWRPYTLAEPAEMQLGDPVWLKKRREPLMRFLVDFSLENHRRNP